LVDIVTEAHGNDRSVPEALLDLGHHRAC
jgi:hypothetical protein